MQEQQQDFMNTNLKIAYIRMYHAWRLSSIRTGVMAQSPYNRLMKI